ncbi:MAG: hypothetical protein ABL973_01790 [Micropepsaceae bacterium]
MFVLSLVLIAAIVRAAVLYRGLPTVFVASAVIALVIYILDAGYNITFGSVVQDWFGYSGFVPNRLDWVRDWSQILLLGVSSITILAPLLDLSGVFTFGNRSSVAFSRLTLLNILFTAAWGTVLLLLNSATS